MLNALEIEVSRLPRAPGDLPPDERYVLYDRRTLERIRQLGGLAVIPQDATRACSG